MLRKSGGKARTKSSPIGPAEHDEGGSLHDHSNQYSVYSKYDHFCPLLPAQLVVGVVGGKRSDRAKTGIEGYHLPPQICEFLVDSLQSHFVEKEGIESRKTKEKMESMLRGVRSRDD